MTVGDTQQLGAPITAALPARVEICECGHPKQWHGRSGFCRLALDIDQECPCRTYTPAFTLILGSYDRNAA